MSQILNFKLKDTLEKYQIYSLIITHILNKKNSVELVQTTKFHNLFNAATKPETPPKDWNIP